MTMMQSEEGQTSKRSMAERIDWIWLCSSLASLVVTLAAMTGLDTPQARPNAVLEGTKT